MYYLVLSSSLLLFLSVSLLVFQIILVPGSTYFHYGKSLYL
jgi:hypothetical protein